MNQDNSINNNGDANAEKGGGSDGIGNELSSMTIDGSGSKKRRTRAFVLFERGRRLSRMLSMRDSSLLW